MKKKAIKKKKKKEKSLRFCPRLAAAIVVFEKKRTEREREREEARLSLGGESDRGAAPRKGA